MASLENDNARTGDFWRGEVIELLVAELVGLRSEEEEEADEAEEEEVGAAG